MAKDSGMFFGFSDGICILKPYKCDIDVNTIFFPISFRISFKRGKLKVVAVMGEDAVAVVMNPITRFRNTKLNGLFMLYLF